jgi:hypothetical protein
MGKVNIAGISPAFIIYDSVIWNNGFDIIE